LTVPTRPLLGVGSGRCVRSSGVGASIAGLNELEGIVQGTVGNGGKTALLAWQGDQQGKGELLLISF
jgi:hypothetical protein